MRRLQAWLLAAGAVVAALVTSSGPAAAATSEPPLKPIGHALNNCAALDSVAVLSATNAWAVGGNTCTDPTELIMHWDGRQTTRVHVPEIPSAGYEEYFGIAAARPSNVWAVGGDSDGHGGDVGLIAHWNGTKWRLMRGPTGIYVESYLSEVRLAANGDAWIAGEVGNHAALVRVRNGKNTIFKIPHAGRTLNGLYLASAKNIWAGGGGYLVHGDGTQWQVMTAPGGADIQRIAGSSPSNIWAIASISGGSSLLHFDWHQWITAAASGSGGPYLDGLSVLGTDMWLSGSTVSGSTSAPYVSHWNGKIQTRITVQLPSNITQAEVHGITATAHGFFAVGQVWNNAGFEGPQWWSTTG